jgi:magnesium transporter
LTTSSRSKSDEAIGAQSASIQTDADTDPALCLAAARRDSSLLHDETGFVRAETRVFLRDYYDHTVQLMDLVESYRDVLSGLMEIYLSSVSIRTNEIMRVLTVITSIFIPLTFIAGVYGMNFVPEFNGRRLPLNMPELHHPLGYIGCLLFMLGVAIVQIVYF